MRIPALAVLLGLALGLGAGPSAAQPRDIAPQRAGAPQGAGFYADS